MKLVNRVNRCTGAVNGHMIVIFLLLRILLVQDYCIVPMHAGADATVQYMGMSGFLARYVNKTKQIQ